MAFDKERTFVGFHSRVSTHESADALARIIEELLAPNGVNTLLIEMIGYQYDCFPEYSMGEFDRNDAEKIKALCKKHNISIVPVFKCLSTLDGEWPLFKAHPELMEMPEVATDLTWPDLYFHHWCASNDDIYQYVFPMIDELIEVFEADALHVGLDEIFHLADPRCKRCAGKDPAELYLHTVNMLHDHLTEKGIQMMMWGDRLLDCKKLGMTMWESDRFGINRAFDRIPKDIVICDWHYDHHDHGYYSTEQFLTAGFYELPALGHQLDQAKHFWGYVLEDLYCARKLKWPGKIGGVLFTNWAVLTAQSAQDMIDGAKGTYTGKVTTWCTASVGETVQTMAKPCAAFRKVY